MNNENSPVEEGEHSFMDRKVSGKLKVGFAVGFLGTQLYNGSQSISTLWFWLNVIKIDPNAYAIIMLVIYNIWNAVNDPIFAHLSDRTRTKWGRRIPWLRAASPLWWISFIFLYNPFIQGQMGLVLYFAITICIYDMLYTICANNYNTLMPEISTKTKERTLMNTYANVFGLIGNAIAFIFPTLFKENVLHFKIYIVVVGAVATLALWIPSLVIKERPIPKEEEEPLGFIASIKETLYNKPFLTFVGSYFLKEAAMSFITANTIIYATHILELEGFKSTMLLIMLLVMSLPGFAVWTKVSEKYGIRKAMFISQLIFSAGIMFMSFIQTFEQALLILAIGGLAIAGPFQFGYVQLAESVDYDELRTNTRREGIYYGTSALLTKPGLGVGQAIVAWILGLTEYVEDKQVGTELIPQPQSDLAKIGIRLTLGVFPSIFMFAGLIFIYLYPLTKEATKKMKEDLAKLHAKKFGDLKNLDKLG